MLGYELVWLAAPRTMVVPPGTPHSKNRGAAWYEVQLTIPARTQAPLWQEWKAYSKGKTPREAAQVVAFEVLSWICQ